MKVRNPTMTVIHWVSWNFNTCYISIVCWIPRRSCISPPFSDRTFNWCYTLEYVNEDYSKYFKLNLYYSMGLNRVRVKGRSPRIKVLKYFIYYKLLVVDIAIEYIISSVGVLTLIFGDRGCSLIDNCWVSRITGVIWFS